MITQRLPAMTMTLVPTVAPALAFVDEERVLVRPVGLPAVGVDRRGAGRLPRTPVDRDALGFLLPRWRLFPVGLGPDVELLAEAEDAGRVEGVELLDRKTVERGHPPSR